MDLSQHEHDHVKLLIKDNGNKKLGEKLWKLQDLTSDLLLFKFTEMFFPLLNTSAF